MKMKTKTTHVHVLRSSVQIKFKLMCAKNNEESTKCCGCVGVCEWVRNVFDSRSHWHMPCVKACIEDWYHTVWYNFYTYKNAGDRDGSTKFYNFMNFIQLIAKFFQISFNISVMISQCVQ